VRLPGPSAGPRIRIRVPASRSLTNRALVGCAVAALCAGPLDLDDPSCVNKSFPAFWEVWQSLTSPGD